MDLAYSQFRISSPSEPLLPSRELLTPQPGIKASTITMPFIQSSLSSEKSNIKSLGQGSQRDTFSTNWPAGPIWSSSRNVHDWIFENIYMSPGASFFERLGLCVGNMLSNLNIRLCLIDQNSEEVHNLQSPFV